MRGQQGEARRLFLAGALVFTMAFGVAQAGEPQAVDADLPSAEELFGRVAEAREQIGSVSYRVVSSRESRRETVRSFARGPDHAVYAYRTIDVVEKGDLRRGAVRARWVYYGGRPEQESFTRVVRNERAIALRRGEMMATDLWYLEEIDPEPEILQGGPEQRPWMWLRSYAPDLLVYGYGDGHTDAHRLRQWMSDPEAVRVSAAERDGRPVLEVRVIPTEGQQAGKLTSLYVIDPERGHLITRYEMYWEGERIRLIEVEPMLVRDHAGGERWFPGRAENREWHATEGWLRWHRKLRFEEVEVNQPVPDDAFELPVALGWEQGHRVLVQDAEGPPIGVPIDFHMYWDGELLDPEQYRAARRAVGDAMIGREAPDFELALLDGGNVRLSDHRGRDIVILEFWTTGCGPCIRLMPDLMALGERYGDRNVVFYSVNLGQEPEPIRALMERQGWEKLAVLLDSDRTVGERYGVWSIPHTVVVDKQGIVRDVSRGVPSDPQQRYGEKIEALLAGGDAE